MGTKKLFGKSGAGKSGATDSETLTHAFGVKLDPNGFDIVSLRKRRNAITHLFFYEKGKLIGACHGNKNPNGEGSDYVNGSQGQPDGDYKLFPKPEEDYDGGLLEYLAGTPSVTGAGMPVGKPGSGYKNTIRFHPCGGSL